MTGRLFVVPAINAMGPVVDPRHDDLLETWQDVDRAFFAACEPAYRNRLVDSLGQPVKFSIFAISWSGFTSNPVHRKFGWHTIRDHFLEVAGDQLARWGDEIYWMYNHPPASGVGNEWGMDWLHNSHYLDVLSHFVIDRHWFPAAVQVPTERNDTSHVLEQWFPYDFGNRNSRANALDSVNADGKLTGEVIDWRLAPHDWSHYRPSHDNYQLPGGMKRTIFRIVDIKSIVHVLTRSEIERAFLRCLEGEDTVLCAYEHDFRDRYSTIMDLLLEPIHDLRREYPEVEIRYATAREAARAVTAASSEPAPVLQAENHREGLRLTSDRPIFGPTPFVALRREEAGLYRHLPVTPLGRQTWRLPDLPSPRRGVLGAAANDTNGNTTVRRWLLDDDGTVISELPDDFRLSPDID